MKDEMNYAKWWVEKYCPSLIKLYMPSEVEWARINIKVQERIKVQDKLIVDKKLKIYENNLFDIMIISINENYSLRERNQCIQLLKYISDTSESIYINLNNSSQRFSFKNTILSILENFDDDKSRYLNSISELFILDKIISSNDLKLKKIEESTNAGTSSDYLFTSNDNKEHLVEILNIYCDSTKWKDEKDLKIFFGKRVSDKIIKKHYTKEILEKYIFSFILNIWCFEPFEIYVKYKSFFDECKIFDGFPVEFCTLVCYEDNNNFTFEYSTISFFIQKFIDSKKNI